MGILATALAACFGEVENSRRNERPHPADVEQPAAPASALTLCGSDVPLTTIRELRQGKLQGDGGLVALEGTPVGRVACTRRSCRPERECCNSCFGTYTLGRYEDQESAQVDLHAPDFECGGMDCSNYCVPLSKEPHGRYRFVGLVKQTNARGEDWSMEVTSWCRIE